jgi:beta-glucanase (GH16 family)
MRTISASGRPGMKRPSFANTLVQIRPLRLSPIAAIMIFALSAGRTLEAHGAWTLVWFDEFNGASVDTNHWMFETGNHNGWGNHELEYYTSKSENIYVRDGLLHIVARKEFAHGFAYTSARVKSEGLFSKKYGRFEFRVRAPHGQGFWPAFWLMPEHPAYGRWPNCGEFDVMENKGNNPGIVQGTIHYAGADGRHLQSTGFYTFPRYNGATNFHTYVLQWTTNTIQWLVDGNLYETQTNWSTAAAPYPAPFDQPFYIIINLAVGGDYGGNPDSTTGFPDELQVDYVRVYEHTDP